MLRWGPAPSFLITELTEIGGKYIQFIVPCRDEPTLEPPGHIGG
jgi:hypothetical protein